MPTLGAPLDFAKLEGRNVRIHQLSTAPSSPVTGQEYYNTTDNTFYWWDGTAWQSAKGGTASGTAGGDLSGTYPNPQIASGVITDLDVNAANKDGVAGTYCLRTLGAGAQQAMPGNRTLDAVPLAVASVNVNNQKIIGLITPTAASDAATKGYVDAATQGLDVKASCRVASTANLNIAAPGNTIDGITMISGDRFLAKDQTTASQNGIYIWNTNATPATRAGDADTSAKVTPGMFTFIEQGTANADSGWILTTDAPISLDTTNLTFTQFSGAGQVTAGAGLTKTGNTLDVIGTTNRITVAADSIDIAATYVGQNSITTLGTVTLGVWQGTPVGIAYGGTGAVQASLARLNLGAAGYYSSATHGAGTTISIPQATHLLQATRGLIVQCQIDSTGAVILPDVVVAANGDVTVTFSVSQSANTIRTTILG
jgi:hypothetical protein